jgi:hypothetical protein
MSHLMSPTWRFVILKADGEISDWCLVHYNLGRNYSIRSWKFHYSFIHSFIIIHRSIQVHNHWIWKSSVVYINILHKIWSEIRPLIEQKGQGLNSKAVIWLVSHSGNKSKRSYKKHYIICCLCEFVCAHYTVVIMWFVLWSLYLSHNEVSNGPCLDH